MKNNQVDAQTHLIGLFYKRFLNILHSIPRFFKKLFSKKGESNIIFSIGLMYTLKNCTLLKKILLSMAEI